MYCDADDVRGDKLLLLGGVAPKFTAHTPASLKTNQLNLQNQLKPYGG